MMGLAAGSGATVYVTESMGMASTVLLVPSEVVERL